LFDAENQAAPVIGFDGQGDDEQAGELSSDPRQLRRKPGVQLPLIPSDTRGAESSLAAPSEAPNALPELEPQPGAGARAVDTKAPQILPHEPRKDFGGDGATSSAAAAKAASKLAKAASRSRRGAWKLPTIEFLRKPPKVE